LRYNEEFHASDEQAYLKVSSTGRKENDKKLQLLDPFAPPQSHHRLLEIGCMHGLFLSQAQNKGYSVFGLDLSASAVQLAEKILPGCIQLGTLDEKIATGRFDVICAFNVIEHMDEPHLFIRQAQSVLAENGFLMIETPSQESLYHHVMFLMAKVFPKKNHEIGINPGGHIFKFGRKAWSTILADNGYRVVLMKNTSTPLKELLAKKAKKRLLTTLVGLVMFGVLARLTGTGNRVIVLAKKIG
jgi:2-polyprenyl-3-methyl-5-hydroxy-6-metoxy-1,4-benzoquinol methylase